MLKILIIINIFLLSSQLWLSFAWASEGTKISQALITSQELANQNQILKEKIYTSSSISYIYEQALAQHLTTATPKFLAPLPVAAARP
ncbi:MAG: hypothetical protein AAB697_01465 [Patescibacteria group bacterium]